MLVLDQRAERAATEKRERQEAERERAAAEAEAEAAAAAAAAEQRAAEKLARQTAVFDSCVEQLGGIRNRLNNIDARLDVGMNQSELSEMVGMVAIAYNRIDIPALGQGSCLSAGAEFEDAYNEYTQTVQTWNDCISDLYCDTDSITPDLQEGWARAARKISRGERHMSALDPSSPTFDPGPDAEA